MLFGLLLLCSAVGPAWLQLNFKFPPLDDEQLNVEWWPDNRDFGTTQASCTFDGECKYGSHESKWKLLSGSISVLHYQSYLMSTDMPRLPAIGFGSKFSDEAHLLSDPLPCLMNSIFRMNVWTWGVWKLQICVLNFELGTFKTCGTAFSGNDSTLNIFTLYQEVPRESSDVSHSAIVLVANVRNGFIILDDLAFNGTQCLTPTGPADITIKNYIVADVHFVRNEILTVLSRQFSRFSAFLINVYIGNSEYLNQRKVSTICRCVPCNFDCDWGNFTTEDGLLSFKRQRIYVKNDMDSWQQIAMVGHFKAQAISYAVITSPKFYYAPSFDYNIQTPYHLLFKANKAACEKQIIVCTYRDIGSQEAKNNCEETKCDGSSNQEWTAIEIELPKGINRFQIIVNKKQPTEYEFDETIIRDINIIGC